MALTKIKDDLYIYQGDTGPLDMTVTNLTPNKQYTAYMQIDMPEKVLLKVTGTTDANGVLPIFFQFEEDQTSKYPAGKFPYANKVCGEGEKHTLFPTPTKKGYFHVLPKKVEEQ